MMNTPRLALGDLSNQSAPNFHSHIYQKVSQSSAVFSKHHRNLLNSGETPVFQKEDIENIFQNTFAQQTRQKSYMPDNSIPEEIPDYSFNKENLEGIFSQDYNKCPGHNNTSKPRFKLDPEERFGCPYTFKEVREDYKTGGKINTNQTLIHKEINDLKFLLSKECSLKKKESSNNFNCFFDENQLNLDGDDNKSNFMRYEKEWEDAINNDEKYDLFQSVALSQKMSEDPAEVISGLDNLSDY